MVHLRGLIACGFMVEPIFQYIAELEQIFCAELNLSRRNVDQGSFFPRSDYGPCDCDLVFVPMARDVGLFRGNHQVIPVVFDVFRKDFDQFCADIANFRLVYLTDTGVCRQLAARGCQQVRFMPFCVADSFVSNAVPQKDIDVIQYGRRDPVLHEHMQRLSGRHPQIHYLWTEFDPRTGRHYFHSNHHGMAGSSDVRGNFWRVMERCKISLVSVPDFDRGGRDGLYTVPIRYFESAAKYCHMISRHPDSGDFKWLGVSEVADRFDDYASFEDLVLRQLSEPFSRPKEERYRAFLGSHVASRRAQQLAHDLSSL